MTAETCDNCNTKRDSVVFSVSWFAVGMWFVSILIFSVVSMKLVWPAAATAGRTRDGGSRSCPIRSSTLRGGTVLCQMCSVPILSLRPQLFFTKNRNRMCAKMKQTMRNHDLSARFTHLEQKSSVDRNGNACLIRLCHEHVRKL